MADIDTQAQYDRTNKVYVSGITERNTKADRNAIGDFTVAMTCPKGVPREIPLSRVRDLVEYKNFTIGHKQKEVPKPKRVTKKQAQKDVDILYKEAGGVEQ